MTNFSRIKKLFGGILIILAVLLLNACGSSAPAVPEEKNITVDVLVVGAEPEGIAAAVAAARSGAKVLLADSRQRPGGLYVLGELNSLDLNYKSDGSKELINQGFFAEFHQAVGAAAAFEPPQAEKFFRRVLADEGIPVALGWELSAVLQQGSIVKGASFKDDRGAAREVTAARVIDATPDGDLAAMAGAGFFLAREDLGVTKKFAAATLMFSLSGVDWDRVADYLQGDGDPYTGATSSAAWGYAEMFNYQALDPQVQIRGLNIGRQTDGTVLINALQIFDVNPIRGEDQKQACEKASRELPGIVAYMRDNLVGFADAKLAGTAAELYIRESRHIVGQKRLTADDVFSGNIFPDTIALGSYPPDLQASEKGQTGSALGGTFTYGIPLGALIPRGVDRLLVAGKAAGYSSVAHGSARTVPVGMAVGQAAGVSAAYSLEVGSDFSAIDKDETAIREIRRRLAGQGADLTVSEQQLPEQQSWSYPYIQYLRDRGLVSKGYYNDYKTEDTADRRSFERMYVLIDYNSDLPLNTAMLKDFPALLDQGDVLGIINASLGSGYTSFQEVFSAGVIDAPTLRHISQNKDDKITNAEAYALVAGLVNYLNRRQDWNTAGGSRPLQVERLLKAIGPQRRINLETKLGMVLLGDKVYLEAEKMANLLGARLDVDGPTVIMEYQGRILTMAAGSIMARVNGREKILFAAVWQDWDKTYLPVESVIKLLGFTVEALPPAKK